ncbi:hypothetical protein ACHQM5_030043 [Ranunculus cassubicifolius]
MSHHHPATDDLENVLTKANHDLTVVMNKLDSDFRHTYPDDVNPLKLLSRIKKIQEDLNSVKIQCGELLSAKQDLIDKARATLVANRSLVQRMQISSGVSTTNDSEDPAYTNFNKIIDEWTVQVRSKTGGEKHEVDSEDINQLLFS